MATAIAALTCNPARIIGVDAGHLGVNAVADVCIFNPNVQWVLQEENFRSRGHNSPFIGRTMTGLVDTTIIAGKIVFQKDNLTRSIIGNSASTP